MRNKGPVGAVALFLAIAFTINNSAAQATKPNWVKASDLFSRYEATQDLSYLENVFLRCSAYNISFGYFIIRDRPELLIGQQMLTISAVMQQAADLVKAINTISRGGTPDFESNSMDSDIYRGMQDNYIDWFNFNYINYGEYSGDPELQAESQFCNTTLYGQVESIVERITPN